MERSVAFTRRRTAPHGELTPPTLEGVVSIQFGTTDGLDWQGAASWEVVGHGPRLNFADLIDLDLRRHRGFIGTRVLDSGTEDDPLNACFALASWDPYLDPEFFDKLRLSSGQAEQPRLQGRLPRWVAPYRSTGRPEGTVSGIPSRPAAAVSSVSVPRNARIAATSSSASR